LLKSVVCNYDGLDGLSFVRLAHEGFA